MITKLFYFDLSETNFFAKISKIKHFKQNLRHQVVEAEALRVEAEVKAIQKLPLPHLGFELCAYSTQNTMHVSNPN